MQTFVFGLEGARIVFPDGVPLCLSCGDAVSGTRRVFFEPVDDFVMPTHAGKLLSHFKALRQRVVFDAPLCEAHLRRAKSLSRKAPLYGLASLGLLLAAVLTLLQTKLYEQSKAAWLLLAPGVVMFFITYDTWIAKDRGGLPCEATRLEDGSVLLKYPDSTPSAP